MRLQRRRSQKGLRLAIDRGLRRKAATMSISRRTQCSQTLRPSGRRGVGRCMGLLLTALIIPSGCNSAGRFSAPRRLPWIAAASPLPPSYSQPPVEPPPPPAPAASIAVETPVVEPPQPPPVVAEAPPASSLRQEIDQLKAELAAL